VFCSGLFCYARSKERKPNLNYQFSHDEVTLLRLALGIALRQFEDCLDGEAPQMLAYINQPSWSDASQAARAMIEQLSIPGVVVTIGAQARPRNSANSSAPVSVTFTKVPLSCITSQPHSIASRKPALYSAGVARAW
jgi:hypothetical protein